MDTEYEILPHQLLSDLKYDVEALKKKLSSPDAKMEELVLEIESLKDSIHDLNMVFEKALEQTKEEDVGKTIKTMSERIDSVVSQNETIAKGMIAISDKLEEFMKGAKPAPRPSAMPQQPRHTMGTMPPQPGPGRVAPRPMGVTAGAVPMPQTAPTHPGELPPPPPSTPKKKGLFK